MDRLRTSTIDLTKFWTFKFKFQKFWTSDSESATSIIFSEANSRIYHTTVSKPGCPRHIVASSLSLCLIRAASPVAA